ncbi:MAG: hypothetical protein OQK78_00370, partial [Gammaproteobacteria bacterium]|nr:hypothetical protein [Gammaproteobacteria bacterium]
LKAMVSITDARVEPRQTIEPHAVPVSVAHCSISFWRTIIYSIRVAQQCKGENRLELIPIDHPF